MTPQPGATVHPSADVSSSARLGAGTRVWHFAQVREGASLGEECILGKGAYVGEGVQIGNRVKVENNASIFAGSTLEDGVFIGPHACLANDRTPRAINPDGRLKGADDWERGTVLIRAGAALGAGAIVVPNVRIGRWALVGAGAVVVRDVPDYGLVLGNPARLVGYACCCGQRLTEAPDGGYRCPRCGASYEPATEGGLRPASKTQPASSRPAGRTGP